MWYQIPLRSLIREGLILVYQMPKAGSQTVEATLQPLGLPARILRFHYLSRYAARNLKYGLAMPGITEQSKADLRAQLELRQLMVKALRARRWRSLWRKRISKVSVITAVRDPIGVCLSSMFENYYPVFGDDRNQALAFCRKMLTSPDTLKGVQNWFDTDFKPFFGLNVYRRPFPRERGYAIYENRFARVLVYRFEALSSLPGMLKEFLGCTATAIVDRNIGTQKEYGQLYREVRAAFRLPAPLVRKVCQSRLMRHFYSPEERHRFEQQWAEAVPGGEIQSGQPAVLASRA